MARDKIEAALDRLERDRERASEDEYRRHLKHDRFRRWRVWACRIEESDE